MSIIKHNVADALFSKVQQRVLGLLFAQPDRSFYTNEIIRLTQSGTGAVQRELAKLETVGLITLTTFGNQKLYQANRDTPLFAELHSIVLKTFGLSDILKEDLKPIASQIQVAFIYGSIAKHEDKANSDIDLMIIGEDLSYAVLFPLLEKAQTQLGRKVNPTCYTSKEWMRKYKEGNNFINQIIKQPKIFLIGTEDALI